MKNILILGMILALAGCGGGTRSAHRGGAAQLYTPTAKGPIRSACLASDRKARSNHLCGCIQAVADRNLSRSDQSRAVRFYSNPQAAQDIRQSSRSGDKSFWKAYSTYAREAERICT